jgi:FlaA1/EpsC-like NDP-sugar epimerase
MAHHTWAFVNCLAITAASYWLAWLLRFEFSIPASEMPVFREGLAIVLAAKVLVFYIFGVHRNRWSRYVAFSDLLSLLEANLVASVVTGLAFYFILASQMPRSIYALDFLICTFATGGVRFAVRLLHEMRGGLNASDDAKGLLIYGAGVAGLSLAREIRSNPSLGYRVLGFLDDDPRKRGAQLLGLPVLGSGDDAVAVVEAYRERRVPVGEIAVAMPSAPGKQIRAAVEKGRAAHVPCRIVPSLGELISGKLSVRNMREISVTDLLGRDPVQLDVENVRRAVAGRVVMVTGAAGSIGSELCSQLAQFEPRTLVALDQAETEMFRLEADLRGRYPGLTLVPEIGDIRDPRRMEELIEQHGVESIFHAAAYKHVPIMERHVCEAVRNNVIGTWNLVQVAWRMNVSRFLLISSDKAVNPSSVMGLTKRIAELIVSAARPPVGRGPATQFVCVRFGNVLVSNGSVVPTFHKQIAAGGPVTVTHPDMTRYFMTVQEAVQLVLQASTMGKGSEIFVLDMGTPMRIVELARKMITLAGMVPDEDIDIRFTGLRPGEKMFEELRLDAENLLSTTHEKIRIFQGQRLALDELLSWIAELEHLLWRRDPDAVIAHLKMLVPEYRPYVAEAPAAKQPGKAAARVAAAASGAY